MRLAGNIMISFRCAFSTQTSTAGPLKEFAGPEAKLYLGPLWLYLLYYFQITTLKTGEQHSKSLKINTSKQGLWRLTLALILMGPCSISSYFSKMGDPNGWGRAFWSRSCKFIMVLLNWLQMSLYLFDKGNPSAHVDATYKPRTLRWAAW